MALLTSGQISRVAIALLTRMLKLPRTVTTIPGSEFAGSNGDTITIRVPQPTASRVQTAGSVITFDDIDEVPVAVQVNHLYHAKLVTDEELSLEIFDFARQILRPQIAAVATGAENEVTTAIASVPAFGAPIQFPLNADPAADEAVILAAREELSTNDVPDDDRWFVCSPSIMTRVLSIPKFVRVDESGSDQALRRAIVGRLYGFEFLESNGLAADTAAAYHSSGIGMGNRVPVRPSGAVDSSTQSSGGVGLRHIRQYVPDRLSDASVVSTFAGASPVADVAAPAAAADYPRIIHIDTSAT